MRVLTESPYGFPVLLLIVDTNRIKYVHGRPESAEHCDCLRDRRVGNAICKQRCDYMREVSVGNVRNEHVPLNDASAESTARHGWFDHLVGVGSLLHVVTAREGKRVRRCMTYFF
jgi:hypothetical protein